MRPGMFRRWLILLLVGLGAAILAFVLAMHRADEAEKAFAEIHDECMAYLGGRDAAWKPDDDSHYHFTCDSDNPTSNWSLKLRYRSSWYDMSGFALLWPIAVLSLVFLSFLLRWLFTGRIKP